MCIEDKALKGFGFADTSCTAGTLIYIHVVQLSNTEKPMLRNLIARRDHLC